MTTGLTSQTIVIGIGRFLNIAVAAGTLMILARVLPDKVSYGAVSQIIMLYMVLSQIFSVGLPQSTYYFLPRYEGGERRGFVFQTILLLMLSGSVLGAGMYFGADALGRLLGNAMLPDLLRIFAVYPFFMLPTLAVEGTLLHAKRPVATVLFNSLIRVGMFGALVIPSVLHVSLAQTLRIWMGVGAIMWVAAVLLMLSTVRGLPLVWRRDMLKDEWAFSLPLAGVTLLTIAAYNIDRFLVSNTFGAAAFGIYANAAIDIPTVTTVTTAVSTVLMAEFSRRVALGEMKELLEIWHRAITRSAVLIFTSLGFLAFWAHETMRLLFSERFAESGVIFSVFVWIIPLKLIAAQSLFVALGATRVLTGITAFGLVMGAIFVYSGGQLFGLPGMAVGSVLTGYLNMSLAVYYLSSRLTDIGLRHFLPWRRIGMVLLMALAAGAISRGLFWLGMRHWPMLAAYCVALIVFLLCYTAGLSLLHMHHLLIPSRLLRRFQRSTSPADETMA